MENLCFQFLNNRNEAFEEMKFDAMFTLTLRMKSQIKHACFEAILE